MLGLTWLLWFMSANDRELMYRVQPEIVKEWHLSSGTYGFYVSMFFLAYALVALPAGIYADRVGRGWRRRISQSWYMLVLTTTSILTGVRATGSQLWQFITWRTLGLGAAGGAEVTNVALCSEYWPAEDRGFALGLHHTGYPFGALVGGFATAGLLSEFGAGDWRLAFLITPLIGFPLIVGLWAFATPKSWASVDAFAKQHGLTSPADESDVVKPTWTAQLKATHTALSNRNILLTVIAAFLINFALTIGQFDLPFYVNSVKHDNVSVTALLGAVPYITGWIGQLLWGTVSDYIGRKRTLMILSGWYVVAMLLLVPTGSNLSVILALLFWGLALNAVFPVYYAMIADHSPDAAGSAMGLLLMMVFLGSVPANWIGGSLIGAMGGYGSASGYYVGFGIGAAASLIAFLVQWLGTRDAPSLVGAIPGNKSNGVVSA
jgi:MFS family permease